MADDEGTEFVRAVKHTEAGMSVVVKWTHLVISGVVALIFFGVTIGTILTKSSQQEKAFDDFRVEVRARLDKSDTASIAVIRLTDKVEQLTKEGDTLKADQAEDRKILAAYVQKTNDSLANINAKLR